MTECNRVEGKSADSSDENQANKVKQRQALVGEWAGVQDLKRQQRQGGKAKNINEDGPGIVITLQFFSEQTEGAIEYG